MPRTAQGGKAVAGRADAGLEEQAAFARSLGFRGKVCIHPEQVPIVNRVFLPSEREIAWAQRVVDEFEASGEGVLRVNGEMIDLPVAQRARRILEEMDFRVVEAEDGIQFFIKSAK